MKSGLNHNPLPCADGECEEITELPDVSGFIPVHSRGLDVYYYIPSRKSLHLPWGTIETGKISEAVIWSSEKKRGFRCIRGAL